MRNMILATTFAALFAFASGPMISHAIAKPEKAAKAQHQKKVKKEHKPGLRGEYATMAKELQLTPEQQTKLLVLVTQQQTAAKDWDNKNKADWTKARADLRSADPATKKQARETYKSLNAERNSSRKGFQDKALAVLTPEQNTQWAGYKLAKSAESSLKRHKIKLTDDQTDQVKTLAATAVKDLDINDNAALRKAQADLNKQINETVLTQDQRQALPQPKAHKAKKAKKAKGHKKAKTKKGAAH